MEKAKEKEQPERIGVDGQMKLTFLLLLRTNGAKRKPMDEATTEKSK